MTIVGDKGYVTNWGSGLDSLDDYVAVINLTTNTIENNTISLDEGVEQITAVNNKLYVTHKGAWSTNNIVSVVDLNNSNSVTEIEVNYIPDEIIVDDSDNIIVLCQANPLTYNDDYSVVLTVVGTSSITFIDTESDEVEREITFPETQRADFMSYDSGKIYYYQGSTSKVYQIDESATELATQGIDVGTIYGMSVRGSELYTVSYAFTNLSEFKAYDVSSGEELYSSGVGVGASKIYFND